MEEDAIECAFRDRSAVCSPILRQWRLGCAHLKPSLIVFEPYISLGLRIHRPRTAPIEIPIIGVSEAHRSTSGREIWRYRGEVFELDTGIGTIEWGLPALSAAGAIEAVSAD